MHSLKKIKGRKTGQASPPPLYIFFLWFPISRKPLASFWSLQMHGCQPSATPEVWRLRCVCESCHSWTPGHPDVIVFAFRLVGSLTPCLVSSPHKQSLLDAFKTLRFVWAGFVLRRGRVHLSRAKRDGLCKSGSVPGRLPP